MDRYTEAWNSNTKAFDLPPKSFDLSKFTELLKEHTALFNKKDYNQENHFGYIEKFDLDPASKPQIYMRADLHGDLKSLIENLRSLQKQGLLDKNFKCKPGVHLVFLGDYCDRGVYGIQILELLIRLREENPHQIHLIRGNHEDTNINLLHGYTDENLRAIISNDNAREALKNFYGTMSLTTYFSLNQSNQREYVQCTHGLFEPTMDAAPLLDHEGSSAYLLVPKTRRLSNRITKIAQSNSPLSNAARRISAIVANSRLEDSITVYNWGDVSDITRIGFLGERCFSFSAQDIRHYLDLSSERHRVMMLFRGHQHGFQHLKHHNEVIATTLPVGMDCPGYQNQFEQPDRAYIIKPDSKVANWKKRAILREKGAPVTDRITPEHPLTSSAI